MGMQTGEAVKGLARLGKKQVILVPIAFTSDHIETLYEIDLEYMREGREVNTSRLSLIHCFMVQYLQLGMEMQRAESLNESPVFIRALADIAAQHFRDYSAGKSGPMSVQMGLRCPGCKNATCGQQKHWFARAGQS